ncbi:SGNH/GDSL hydrolase family protein [Enterococcus sp. AD013-P3]|uniref:SGNH/GDSL hydrolase family protein n=1 Tax=Enterococcus sp. AD013-P3 TaxID=3411036 RepID=UPI003B956428
MELRKNDRLLFLGDSVTDCDRDRTNPTDLGKGYVLMTAGILAARHPEAQLTFLNRGIGGNKIQDVLNRLDEDCLSLQPDILIFMIGINDTWHNVGGPEFGKVAAAEAFEKSYREFLNRVTAAGIKRILLLEPFVLPFPEDRQLWRSDLDPKIQILRNLACEFHCELLCLDGRLNETAAITGPQYLTGIDGVHPTATGHGVIAGAVSEKFRYPF